MKYEGFGVSVSGERAKDLTLSVSGGWFFFLGFSSDFPQVTISGFDGGAESPMVNECISSL